MLATAEDVARFLDIGQPDTAERVQLDLALAATVEAVQAYTGRTWDLITEDTVATERIYRGGMTSGLVADVEQADTTVEGSFDRQSWTEVSASSWYLTPLNEQTGNVVCSDWGHFAPWVRVTGRHGVFEIPAVVKQATVIKAAALFKRNPEGTTYGGDFGPIRISRFEDPDVARLLDSVARPALSIA